jgi:hypothetical protein
MTKLSQRRRIAQARVDGLLDDAGSILLALSAYPLNARDEDAASRSAASADYYTVIIAIWTGAAGQFSALVFPSLSINI